MTIITSIFISLKYIIYIYVEMHLSTCLQVQVYNAEHRIREFQVVAPLVTSQILTYTLLWLITLDTLADSCNIGQQTNIGTGLMSSKLVSTHTLLSQNSGAIYSSQSVGQLSYPVSILRHKKQR